MYPCSSNHISNSENGLNSSDLHLKRLQNSASGVVLSFILCVNDRSFNDIIFLSNVFVQLSGSIKFEPAVFVITAGNDETRMS